MSFLRIGRRTTMCVTVNSANNSAKALKAMQQNICDLSLFSMFCSCVTLYSVPHLVIYSCVEVLKVRCLM